MYMKKSLAVLGVMGFLLGDASCMIPGIEEDIVQHGSACGLTLGKDKQANAAVFDKYFREQHDNVIAFLEQEHDKIDTAAPAETILAQVFSVEKEFEKRLNTDVRFLLQNVSFEFNSQINPRIKAARMIGWIRDCGGTANSAFETSWNFKSQLVLTLLQSGLFAGDGQAVADFIRKSEEYLLPAIPKTTPGNWCGLWAGAHGSLPILHVGDWVDGRRLENVSLFVNGKNKGPMDQLLEKVRKAVLTRLSSPDVKAEIKRLVEMI